jgi:hypothetical protein
MAYRSDIEALAARDAVLARELADKQHERDAVHQMLEDARAAERAQVLEHDVMSGRRTLRRLRVVAWILVAAGSRLVPWILVAAGSAAVPLLARETTHCPVRGEAISFSYDTTEWLEDRNLQAVALEPRFVSPIGFPTIAELDEAVGAPVPAWESFTYARDASGRIAIASEPYRLGGSEPDTIFVTDGHGALWRLRPSEPFVSTGNGAWTRRIWLVPLGSSFQGSIDPIEIASP